MECLKKIIIIKIISLILRLKNSKRILLYRLNIKTLYKKKNKPSSKILASTQVQSQEIIEKFMHNQCNQSNQM